MSDKGLRDKQPYSLHMSHVYTECDPETCPKCQRAFVCGETTVMLAGHPPGPRYWVCGNRECAVPGSHWTTYYCSLACYQRHYRARRRADALAQDRICVGCGGTFHAVRRDALYC